MAKLATPRPTRSDKGKPRQRTGKTAAVDQDREPPVPVERPVLVTLAASEPEPEPALAEPDPPATLKAKPPRSGMTAIDMAQPVEPELLVVEPVPVRISPLDTSAIVPRQAFDFVIDKEAMKLRPYLCPSDWVTGGVGRRLVDLETGKPMRGQAGLEKAKRLWPDITRTEAEQWLVEDMEERARAVRPHIAYPISANQWTAILSLVFNIGVAAFLRSTLLKLLNAGHVDKAADEFLRWNKMRVNGKAVESRGLSERRKDERKLFLTGDLPVNVPAGQSSTAKTIRGGLIATAAAAGTGAVSQADPDTTIAVAQGVVTQVAEASGPLERVHALLQGWGIEPTAVLFTVLAGAAVYFGYRYAIRAGWRLPWSRAG